MGSADPLGLAAGDWTEKMTDGASASFGAMVNHGKSRSLTIIEEVNDDH